MQDLMGQSTRQLCINKQQGDIMRRGVHAILRGHLLLVPSWPVSSPIAEKGKL